MGALIFLGREAKSSRTTFFDLLKEAAQAIKESQRAYPLGLIIVDPITAIHDDLYPSRLQRRDSGLENVGQIRTSPEQRRSQLLEVLQEVSSQGINIWLIAEEFAKNKLDLSYEESIADTVIRLYAEERFNYTPRYISVTKSRLQREQRGKHPFSIVSAEGIAVALSSAAVSARIRPRSLQVGSKRVRFGVKGLDEILGTDGISAGDVIVIQGPEGSFRTLLGTRFLLYSDQMPPISAKSNKKGNVRVHGAKRYRSLLINARDDEMTTRHHLINDYGGLMLNAPKQPSDIRVLNLARGYVQPGLVFRAVEQQVASVRSAGDVLDRAMVDNVSNWDLTCPFIKEDETFGDTLVDLLRRLGLTSVFICSEATERDAFAQRSIIDNAQCLIRLTVVDHRGSTRVMARVVKSRGMRHKREAFELLVENDELFIRPTSSLIRVAEAGSGESVPVRLFLHSESFQQKDYNQRILSIVKAILSPLVSLDSIQGLMLNDFVGLSASSVFEELQVLQLDEFHLPAFSKSAKEDSLLVKYPMTRVQDGHSQWVIPKDRVSGNGHIFAFPYFCNIGLLAYRADLVKSNQLETWEAIAEKVESWVRIRKPEDPELFFEFPDETDENYNCLFFEILLSLGTTLASSYDHCVLKAWLSSRDAADAGCLFYRLCHPAHRYSRSKGRTARSSEFIEVNRSSVVWRHWYTTLNQMCAELDDQSLSNLGVSFLPGRHSVAGDWYLAVPRHSAAPDVGQALIKVLTSCEAELDRMLRGVGLPTQSSVYSSAQVTTVPVSPYFALDLNATGLVISQAFRRSTFGCYRRLSGVLAGHLRNLLSSEISTDGLKGRVSEMLSQVAKSLDVSTCPGSRTNCTTCAIRDRASKMPQRPQPPSL
jgi:KaiC/GvpD/RAD55 family RecA-like ATPase